ncbi:hypothetical protein NEOLEDRAFT_1179704 [Neolentinus lepideus HHB14362 ss-1]|uniref:Uncharacterized protein n=1 Tax=Neolentinus lepideus HHB14362 ss-1 TaxID=1314782 RepID=A0A165RKR3_9AGAM|nr:hypothetical protein NEOLEDRAFT_1179704 [Neolentinus lepideus HHB14362 ss-1]
MNGIGDNTSEGSGLRRKAAQRASRSFAAQLTDSDSDEPIPSGASDAFPSPKKGRTVITYSGKRRTIASSEVQESAARPLASTRRKSTKTAAPPPVTPPRQKSKSASTPSPAKKRRLSSSPLSPLTASGGSHATSADPPSMSRASPRKREGSSSTSLSELSALSSSTRSSPARTSVQTPRILNKTASIFSTINSASPSVARTVSLEDEWDLQKLGSFVWVRIDGHGGVVTEDTTDDDASTTAFWWPGRILNDHMNVIPLRVSLFGKPSAYASNTAEVDKPSHMNILSMHSSQHTLRFNSNSFMLPRPPGGFQASPQKKQKTDLETRWNRAVSQMIAEDAEDNDGLVSVSSLFTYAGAGTDDKSFNLGSAKKVTTTMATSKSNMRSVPFDSESDAESARWSPPPPDSLLEIPGELVLARESAKKTEYWPAKIMAYIPPPKKTVKPKYELLYLDSTVHQVTRDLFFTCEEPEFVACKLGQFESTITLEDAQNDDAADDDEIMEDDPPDAYSEMPTPSLPAPPRAEFCELSIPDQFAYVKPILALIMDEKYEPAKGRHEAFMKGGVARVGVCKDAAAKGDLTAVEVAQLRRCLSRWLLDKGLAMRGEHQPLAQVPSSDDAQEDVKTSRLPLPTNEGNSTDARADGSSETEGVPSSPAEMPPSSLPVTDDLKVDDKLSPLTEGSAESKSVQRQDEPQVHAPPAERQVDHNRKTSSFESLSGVERVEYCSNVLLPEAIIQLMLWRWEKRSTLEPEDSNEEVNLHKLGFEKAEETDWVHDILRLRQAKSKSRLKKASMVHTPKSSSKGGSRGTRSRPGKVT